MKGIKILLLVFLTFTVLGCQPPVVFGGPQPENAEPLASVPPEYQGIYWCQADSASLYISSRTFMKQKEFLVKLTREDIDSNPDLALREGRLVLTQWGSTFPIREKSDTILSHVYLYDTIFAISDEQVLKSYRGHLVLNTKLDENAWLVLVASLQGGRTLSLSRAEIPDNMASLDSITPVHILSRNGDSGTQILITPTAEAFGRILDRGLLFDTTCSEFERIFPGEAHIY
jgi:ribosomal protein S24E